MDRREGLQEGRRSEGKGKRHGPASGQPSELKNGQCSEGGWRFAAFQRGKALSRSVSPRESSKRRKLDAVAPLPHSEQVERAATRNLTPSTAETGRAPKDDNLAEAPRSESSRAREEPFALHSRHETPEEPTAQTHDDTGVHPPQASPEDDPVQLRDGEAEEWAPEHVNTPQTSISGHPQTAHGSVVVWDSSLSTLSPTTDKSLDPSLVPRNKGIAKSNVEVPEARREPEKPARGKFDLSLASNISESGPSSESKIEFEKHIDSCSKHPNICNSGTTSSIPSHESPGTISNVRRQSLSGGKSTEDQLCGKEMKSFVGKCEADPGQDENFHSDVSQHGKTPRRERHDAFSPAEQRPTVGSGMTRHDVQNIKCLTPEHVEDGEIREGSPTPGSTTAVRRHTCDKTDVHRSGEVSDTSAEPARGRIFRTGSRGVDKAKVDWSRKDIHRHQADPRFLMRDATADGNVSDLSPALTPLGRAGRFPALTPRLRAEPFPPEPERSSATLSFNFPSLDRRARRPAEEDAINTSRFPQEGKINAGRMRSWRRTPGFPSRGRGSCRRVEAQRSSCIVGESRPSTHLSHPLWRGSRKQNVCGCTSEQ